MSTWDGCVRSIAFCFFSFSISWCSLEQEGWVCWVVHSGLRWGKTAWKMGLRFDLVLFTLKILIYALGYPLYISFISLLCTLPFGCFANALGVLFKKIYHNRLWVRQPKWIWSSASSGVWNYCPNFASLGVPCEGFDSSIFYSKQNRRTIHIYIAICSYIDVCVSECMYVCIFIF